MTTTGNAAVRPNLPWDAGTARGRSPAILVARSAGAKATALSVTPKQIGSNPVMKVTAEQYGEICDVVERTYHGLPLDDDSGFLRTSKEARDAALRIIEILGLDIEDPREISR